MAILDRRRKRKEVLPNCDVAAETLDCGVFILEIPEGGLVASTRDHLGAIGREAFDECPTDPGIASGHHDDAVAPISTFRVGGGH